MKLTVKLMLMFAIVAFFAASLNGWLAHQAAASRFERLVMGEGTGMGVAMGSQRARGILQDLRHANIQATLLALGVAVLCGSYLAYRFTRPLLALTESSRRFASGEREVAVPVWGNDELADLGRAFNAMTAQLAAKEAREKRMLADIAHELRTPLTILKSELEAMQDGLMPRDNPSLEALAQQVDSITALVQDLRLLSLVEAGELQLQPEKHDLALLVAQHVASFRPLAEKKQLRFVSELATLHADVDSQRFSQVLRNLLDNALRHSLPQSCIHLRLERQEHHALLSIRDGGEGMPADSLEHIFERFYRADAARNRNSGGSGLGLAIVSSIVRLHGGEVWAANSPEGGAIFYVRLPLHTPEATKKAESSSAQGV